ncbi:MAG TPA: SRPBCC family protein [Mycobacteriales bacterium]|nr:SRPBCC family protein [Mycobacteriales bacterium]
MKRKFGYEIVEHSAAPVERVFDLLADGAGWSRWAGPAVRHSSWAREGTPAPGGVGAIRRLGSKRGFAVSEEIVAYDRPHHLAYRIVSPPVVRDYLADVHLTPEGDGTRIAWSATFDQRWPGTGRILATGLTASVRDLARRLARAAART